MSAPLAPAVRRALKQIPAIIERDGYASDFALCAELGLAYADLRLAAGILYNRKAVDRCGPYLVAPAPPEAPERAA